MGQLTSIISSDQVLQIKVIDNRLTDVGGGGTPGFVVLATNSHIINNSFTYSGAGPLVT